MNLYVTLTELKQYLGGGLEPLTVEDADDQLLRFCVEASRVFDVYASEGYRPVRKFYPTIETRYFDHPGRGTGLGANDSTGMLLQPVGRGANILFLDQDLVELTTLTTKNGDITILAANYHLSQEGETNLQPYNQIELDPAGTYTQFQYQNTPIKANAVTGWWCYHENWADAWQDTGDEVRDASLGASDTAITVLDADGNDLYGLKYRFKRGGLYKAGDEMFWVTGINTTTQVLTVIRARNGSTAAAHAQGTTIYEYRPPEAIINAMKVLITKIYRRRDQVETGGELDDRSIIMPHGTVLEARSLPSEVTRILRDFSRDTL